MDGRRWLNWSVRVGKVLASALIWTTAGCNDPNLRSIFSESTFVQGETMMHSEVSTIDDTSARAQGFTVTGTPSTQSFRYTIQPGTQGFQQVGTFGQSHSDSFQQVEVTHTAWTVVDILMVVDNSSSMLDEQDRIAQSFSHFLSAIRDIDWRIAVTTTDDAEFGTIRGMIYKNQFSNPQAELNAFNTLIHTGIGGPATERPILNSIGVMQRNPQGFIRSNAALAVVMISDEDSCSSGFAEIAAYNGTPRVGNPPTTCRWDWDTPDAFMAVATNLKGSIDNFGVYGIFWVPGMSGQGYAHEANLLQNIVDRTHKFSMSIWLPDYAQVLQDIATDIADPRHREFVLSGIPNMDSMTVFVNNTAVPRANYTITNNHLVFAESAIPPSLANIRAEYYVGMAPISNVTLNSPAIPTSLSVRVNNQAVSSYTYNPTNRVMTFNPVPPQSAQVVINYDIQPAPRTIYDLDPQDLPAGNSVHVALNHAQLAANQFSVNGSRVTLNTAPGAYDLLEIEQVKRSTLVRQFSLPETPASSVIVMSNGNPMSDAQYDGVNNRVLLNPVTISMNQQVTAQYRVRTGDTRIREMSRDIMPNTMQIMVNGRVLASSEFVVEGLRRVRFLNQQPAVSEVTCVYIENGQLPREFHIDRENVGPVHEVLVDDRTVDPAQYQYDAARKVIIFNEPPAALAKIVVKFE